MNISFNINDTKGASFLEAAKWIVNDPQLTDDQTINKCLRQYIGQAIDSHARYNALNTLEVSLNTLKDQRRALDNQLMQAMEDLRAQQKIVNAIPPTIVP